MDKSFHHIAPTRKGDFYFVTMKMDVKSDKIDDINDINSSATYYIRGGLITVGCCLSIKGIPGLQI